MGRDRGNERIARVGRGGREGGNERIVGVGRGGEGGGKWENSWSVCMCVVCEFV